MFKYYVSNVKILQGAIQEFSWKEFFSETFIRQNTCFGSFNEMLQQSPFDIASSRDTEKFKRIPDDAWDDYVRKTTRFSSWREMHLEAARSNATKFVREQPN